MALVATVLPDVSGVDRAFDYRLTPALAAVRVGTIVRVPLQGRRVRGWVVALGDDAPPGVELKDILEVVSAGPPPDVVALALFAKWRYGGRLRPLLVAGSPRRIVAPRSPLGCAPSARSIAPVAPVRAPAALPPEEQRDVAGERAGVTEAVIEALERRVGLLVLPPAGQRLPVVEAVRAHCRGEDASLLVIVPERRDAQRLGEGLAGLGHSVALVPEAWASARDGVAVVVGTRDAVFAPIERLAGVVVLDAHSEALVETRAPTWRADVLAVARAERAGVPCLLVSGAPTPEQAVSCAVVRVDRASERAGWAPLVVLDRCGDDPRSGLYAERLATLVRDARLEDPGRPVVCVLNRSGRIRLLACGSCGALCRCETCGAALVEALKPEPQTAGELACPTCGARRPRVCVACGSSKMKALRIGVAKAAEELAALTGLAVTEVSGPLPRDGAERFTAPVLVGTEAVLHRCPSASLVVFLDIDQELLAPRLNAGVEALGLLALASRLVGGRRRTRPGSGQVVVQTRLAEHEVLRAARNGDVLSFLGDELERRRQLRLPPATAVALVTGNGAVALREALTRLTPTVETAMLGTDRLLVRAADHRQLADALAAVERPEERVRIEVDPLRL